MYIMSALPTSFVANNGNYVNQDLSEIFAPLVPKNYDMGTLTYFYSSTTTGVWVPVANNATASPAYVKTTNNDVVTITNTIDVGVGTSYFNFSSPGTYKLDITLSLSSWNFAAITAASVCHSLNPVTGRLNYVDLHYGGNCATAASTSAGTIESAQDVNALSIFNITSGAYPILEMKLTATTTAPYYNIYNYSVTFIVPSTATVSAPYQIKPEMRFPSNQAAASGKSLTFSGNWMVTQLN